MLLALLYASSDLTHVSRSILESCRIKANTANIGNMHAMIIRRLAYIDVCFFLIFKRIRFYCIVYYLNSVTNIYLHAYSLLIHINHISSFLSAIHAKYFFLRLYCNVPRTIHGTFKIFKHATQMTSFLP